MTTPAHFDPVYTVYIPNKTLPAFTAFHQLSMNERQVVLPQSYAGTVFPEFATRGSALGHARRYLRARTAA